MIRILVLLLALGSGGAAAWVAYGTLGPDAPQEVAAPAPEAPPPPPAPEILVATAEIGLGRPLTGANFAWRTWPEDAISDAHVQRSAQPDARKTLVGALARGRFAQGEPILESKLVNGDGGFLAAVLDPGERAVAVRISAESTAGGFILPGDRVDVLLTSGEANQGGVDAQVILRNVEVLAIDQTAVEADAETDAVIGKTATLRVDEAAAGRLAAAESQGRLSLALRAAADRDLVVARDEPKPAPEKDPGLTIRVRRAGQSELVRVQ